MWVRLILLSSCGNEALRFVKYGEVSAHEKHIYVDNKDKLNESHLVY